jgi:type IX secretion system PorP/SprF family membrane protein
LKKYIFIFVFIGTLSSGRAQQTAQFTQYLFNQFGHHPALAGWRDCLEFRLGYRTQWVNYPGAPKTAFANFHTSLTRKKKGHLRSKHGIGANIESDQMGPFGITRIYLAYAYHIPFNRKFKMSMGLYGGIQQYKLDVGKITLENYDDQAISGKTNVIVYPDVWPSLFLYSNDFFAGITLRQAFKNKIKKITADSRLRHHYNITAGKRFKIGKFDAIPSFNFKWATISAPDLDLNCLFDFSSRYMLGLSWRNTDAVAILGRLNIRNFSFGYSFDFTTSKIKDASSNTHEFVLGINTCRPDKRNSDECPVFN